MSERAATPYDLVVTGGLVVTPDGARTTNVAILDGVVAQLDADPAAPARRIIDAGGLVVLPGLVDPHAHFWDPGATAREDWAHGSRSALAGGVTTVVEMPLSVPPTVDTAALEEKVARVREHSVVDAALWGGVVPAAEGEIEERMAALAARGISAFKLFMCDAAREFPACGPEDVRRVLREAVALGVVVGIHAEDPGTIHAAEARLRAEGRQEPLAYAASRSLEAELAAVERAVAWSGEAGATTYIVHMSSAEALALVRRARDGGQRVHAETCPHYLTLDLATLEAKGPWAKCAPPLRDAGQVDALWDRVLDGTVDTIGSDHAPFTAEEKRAGEASIWDAPNGLTGIQTMLPLLVDEGIHRRGLSWERLAALTSTNAADIFRLAGKGRIAEGAAGDLVLVDPDEEWTVTGSDLLSVQRWTPYERRQLRGRVKTTLLAGTPVFDGTTVSAEPGSGRLLNGDSRS